MFILHSKQNMHHAEEKGSQTTSNNAIQIYTNISIYIQI